MSRSNIFIVVLSHNHPYMQISYNGNNKHHLNVKNCCHYNYVQVNSYSTSYPVSFLCRSPINYHNQSAFYSDRLDLLIVQLYSFHLICYYETSYIYKTGSR